MTDHDFREPRLYVDHPLASGAVIEATPDQAHYLTGVLRLRDADPVLVFNGRDGEWRARLVPAGKKRWRIEALARTRPQPSQPDLHYLFAPLKHARLDYMVQKAVEMGVGRLRPVLTQYGQITRINLERMAANAVEAAEQCGLLTIPVVDPPARLAEILDGWPAQQGARRIVFCDEAAVQGSPQAALAAMPAAPLAVLIGPEGGFAPDERAALLAAPFVTPISLGPRILRADTAAVAALAVVQAAVGDWRS